MSSVCPSVFESASRFFTFVFPERVVILMKWTTITQYHDDIGLKVKISQRWLTVHKISYNPAMNWVCHAHSFRKLPKRANRCGKATLLWTVCKVLVRSPKIRVLSVTSTNSSSRLRHFPAFPLHSCCQCSATVACCWSHWVPTSCTEFDRYTLADRDDSFTDCRHHPRILLTNLIQNI